VGRKLALHVVGRAVVEMPPRKLLVLYDLILPPTSETAQLQRSKLYRQQRDGNPTCKLSSLEQGHKVKCVMRIADW